MDIKIFDQITGFEWDNANFKKNWQKHNVTHYECEQVFFYQPLLLNEDLKHSLTEKRFYVLGKTDQGRRLFIAFTVRSHCIRVISARAISKKEREFYEQA